LALIESGRIAQEMLNDSAHPQSIAESKANRNLCIDTKPATEKKRAAFS
jgi:hypothetical protein